MLEKLGIEKKELLAELQAEYNRKRHQEFELRKTGAPAPQRAQVANELSQIKQRLDQLQTA
jgi:hypothetical protein